MRFIWIPLLWVYGLYKYKFVLLYSAGNDVRRQNLTSTNVIFWLLKSIPALLGLKSSRALLFRSGLTLHSPHIIEVTPHFPQFLEILTFLTFFQNLYYCHGSLWSSYSGLNYFLKSPLPKLFTSSIFGYINPSDEVAIQGSSLFSFLPIVCRSTAIF